MPDAFTLCVKCETTIPFDETAHLAHEDDCLLKRAMADGVCRCDGWLCLRCCPEPGCSPLQMALQEARAETRKRAEVWERNLAAADKARPA